MHTADPPIPPTSLTVTLLDACLIRIDWSLPDSLPSNTAEPDYIIIEIEELGSGEWTELGYRRVDFEATDDFLLTNITLDENNTDYVFRLRALSGNDSQQIGEGNYYYENTTFSVHGQGILYSVVQNQCTS